MAERRAANATWAELRLAAYLRDSGRAVAAATAHMRGIPPARATAAAYGFFLGELAAGRLLDVLLADGSPPASLAAVAETVVRFVLEGDDRIDRRTFADYFVWDVLAVPALAHLLPLVEPACSEGRVARCLELQRAAGPAET